MEISDDEEPLPPKDKDSWNSVSGVEVKLNYQFKNKKLLEEALTHPSCKESPSYERLEFIGDAVLGLVVANSAFLAYPTADEGILTLLRSVNTSNLYLARIALRHRLFHFLRHNNPSLDAKVREFALIAEAGDDTAVYGGKVKPPMVLADIVESVIGAVYIDCDFDLKFLWQSTVIISCRLLGVFWSPLVTLEALPFHVKTMLNEFSQKEGKKIDIKHSSKGVQNICSIYVDGKLIATGSSNQKDIAQLKAAKKALEKLNKSVSDMDIDDEVNDKYEIESAKQKLYEICSKRKWPKPTYRIENEVGVGHEKRYICSVEIETTYMKLLVSGDEKVKIKMAENSAASVMIHNLMESCYI